MAGLPATILDAATRRLTAARARAARVADWRRRVAREVAALPDTMEELRRGAANFQLVGDRLARSSASLEEIANLYESTIAASGRRSEQAVDALRSQVDALAAAAGPPETIAARMNEVQRAFDSVADLNPFWPRSGRKR